MRDPNNLPDRDPRGDHKPEPTDGLSRRDDRYLRSVVEDSSETMKVTGPDWTLRSGPGDRDE